MYIDHNVLFSGDYISAFRGCFDLKILHALEIGHVLLAHIPTGTGVLPQKKNFNRENLKFGLKFSVWATITSGLVGVSSQNFFHSTCRRAGVIMWVPFLEAPPPLKFGRAKKCQKFRFGAISDNFRLWSRLSSEWIVTSKVSKNHHQLQPLPRQTKKNRWTLIHKQQSQSGSYWPTQVDIFREITFRPLGDAAPSNF